MKVPAHTKEARLQRLQQRAHKFTPKPRKGSRGDRRRAAIREAS